MSDTSACRPALVHAAIARRGLLLVLSSPSGAGKTTLARRLLAADRDIAHVGLGDDAQAAARRGGRPRLPSSSTRPSSSACATAASCSNGRSVFGNSLRHAAAPVEAALAAGKDVLFDIDWQGAQQLRRSDGARRGARVHPAASAAALEQRLRARAQDRRRRGGAAHGRGRRPRSATGPSTTTSSSTPTWRRASRGLTAILAAERLKRERLDGPCRLSCAKCRKHFEPSRRDSSNVTALAVADRIAA